MSARGEFSVVRRTDLLAICVALRDRHPTWSKGQVLATAKLEWHKAQAKPKIENLCVCVFRDAVCRYNGGQLSCDKTFESCRTLGNQANFQGTPK
jgi:hypothetical protein